jgi:hypothetical protein
MATWFSGSVSACGSVGREIESRQGGSYLKIKYKFKAMNTVLGFDGSTKQ